MSTKYQTQTSHPGLYEEPGLAVAVCASNNPFLNVANSVRCRKIIGEHARCHRYHESEYRR